MKGFRGIKSKLTGHGESHLNPAGRALEQRAARLGACRRRKGLALADKVRKNDRVTICTVSDGASMEGEAKEAFAAIPGLAAKGRLNPFVLVVSDNDTKLSGRISIDAFTMAPTFAAMSALGWNVIKVANGNDLQSVYLALENGLAAGAGQSASAPVCLWAKTVKGFGVRSTVESAAGGHGFPLANAEKIVDFVNEIYFGAPEVPAELADWARALRSRLGAKGSGQKGQSRGRPRRRRRSKRKKSRPAWPRAPCAPRRRACPFIPFPPTWRARPASAFSKRVFPTALSRWAWRSPT